MLLAGPARISSHRLQCGSDQLARTRTAADMGWRHQRLTALALDSAKPMPRRCPVLPQRYPSFFPSCPHRFPSGFPTGAQGSTGLAYLVSGERVLDDTHDVLLLVARKLARALENLPQLPRRAAAASLRFARAHQLRRGNPQGGGDSFKLIVSQRDGAAFPLRVRPLGEAEFFGELRLGKPDLFAQVVQALSERWARKLGGSAGVHARIIRAGGQS